MKDYQFKLFVLSMFRDKGCIDFDTWWKFIQSIEGLNRNHKNIISYLICKALGKSMPEYLPQTTKTGGLPNISFIEMKPYPLVTESNSI